MSCVLRSPFFFFQNPLNYRLPKRGRPDTLKDCQISLSRERAALGRLLLAEWVCVGGELRAAPLDEKGDPPLVANLVKTEMRLQVGAGK